MRRVRLILAWLLLAAVPLQGFAAVTMLLCRSGETVRGQAAHHQHPHAGAGHHEHAMHGDAADGHAMQTGNSQDQQDADSGHGCAVCASCCHVVAVGTFAVQLHFAPLPRADAAEPFVPVHARVSPVPDKPPRA